MIPLNFSTTVMEPSACDFIAKNQEIVVQAAYRIGTIFYLNVTLLILTICLIGYLLYLQLKKQGVWVDIK